MSSRQTCLPYPHSVLKLLICVAGLACSAHAGTTFTPHYYLPVTYYDFHQDFSNPEFECALLWSHPWSNITTGMVDTVLDVDGKPMKNPDIDSTYLVNHIDKWYRPWEPGDTIEWVIPGRDTVNCHADSSRPDSLDLGGGLWIVSYPYNICDTVPIPPDSMRSDTAFMNVVFTDSLKFTPSGDLYRNGRFMNVREWPIDGKGFVDELTTEGGHNDCYSMEMHNRFVYHGAESLRVATDDDCWVFVDGRLAIDGGGIHALRGLELQIDSLGLTVGDTIDFDLFYAERSMGGCFNMESSIDFLTMTVGADTFVTARRGVVPGQVPGNAVTAMYVNGALHLTLPPSVEQIDIAVYSSLGREVGAARLRCEDDPVVALDLPAGVFCVQAQFHAGRGGVVSETATFMVR